ncbi:LysR family transcriptional regulator [Noviherbaspirillum denitrificans]|uniref:LysR family transcriptional regulator n=1 Tax=Noviherbaspirillum denitrificans TaxID=1968433 RepID=UPI000B52AD1C|nr:LysR family transcriptional regulator [Noviherbaspirillum denitrificans]
MELLNDMALFVDVVKAKGFRHAADITGIPSSTISRRISELEKAVGLRLLQRSTRRIELTEAGRLYFERCKRIVDDARIAHEQLTGFAEKASGLLRASLPVDFGAFYLAPLVARFAELYPGISFEFDLTPRRVDLVSEPIDVAIRIGELPDSGLIARQVASLPRHLYATPAYLERAGTPIRPEDLSLHDCLRMTTSARSSIWTLEKGGSKVSVEVSGRFSLNSVGMMRRLTLLDLGIAAIAEEIAREDAVAGRLRRVLPDWSIESVPVYALTETRLLPAKTQLFIEYLRENLGSPQLRGALAKPVSGSYAESEGGASVP